MSISRLFDRLHRRAKSNLWLWLFSIFCRVSLAFAFLAAGIVKITDERFAAGLHDKHPMGAYLEALHHTGFYYAFVGVAQIAAAVFLLIPRTVTLGAFIYFPIIFNIWILTYAARFDGALFTAPLMTLANLFLLGWNYEKWKFILPFNDAAAPPPPRFENDTANGKNAADRITFFPNPPRFIYARLRDLSRKLFTGKFPYLNEFPWLFFAGVFAAVIFFAAVVPNMFSVLPHNTYEKCLKQFKNTPRTAAGENFCTCIHTDGDTLTNCLNAYETAPNDPSR